MHEHLDAATEAEAAAETDGWYSEERATFGDRLAAAREAAGLSQKNLAKRLGVKAKTVSGWENDVSEPRANRLQMLAGLLNVSLMWLLTGEGPGIAAPGAGSATGATKDAAEVPGIGDLRAELIAARRDLARATERLGRIDRQLAAVLEGQ